MILCTNCGHTNPDAASHCEACFTLLPTLNTCHSCQAKVAADAVFCPQCGVSLAAVPSPLPPTDVVLPSSPLPPTEVVAIAPGRESGLPATAQVSSPPGSPLPQVGNGLLPTEVVPVPATVPASLPETISAAPVQAPAVKPLPPTTPYAAPGALPDLPEDDMLMPTLPLNMNQDGDLSGLLGAPARSNPAVGVGATRLQVPAARLLHVQTNTILELPVHLSVIHLGKPNQRTPPDLDVAGFPDSDVVSRVHAQIRIEAGQFYLEDVGSSNGTFVNNQPLSPGDRHRLRSGDRFALGKEDKVSFIFQQG